MVVLNNNEVIEMVDNAILNYNNSLYNGISSVGEIEAQQLPLYDEDNGISEEVLEKLKNFGVFIRRYDTQDEQTKQELESELLLVISHMDLSTLTVHYVQKSSEGPAKTLDLTKKLLDAAGTKLDTLYVRGADLSTATKELLPNYEHLKSITFSRCGLSDPSLIKNLSNDISINFESIEKDIGIDKENEFVNEIFKRNGKFRVKSGKLEKIPEAIMALQRGSISLSQYVILKDRFDLSTIPDLQINVDQAFDLDEENLGELVDSINSLKNAKFIASIDRYRKIKEIKDITIPTQLDIKDASELGASELENYPFVESVSIKSPYTQELQKKPYSVDDYKLVREKIDEIISGIPNGATEREKFAYIYKELGKRIDYNFYAVTDEGKKDEALQTSCRNLYDGLVKGKAVCAGYADILFNTLACAGIESRYISGMMDIENGASITFTEDKKLKLEPGHAWNQVKLDGKWYYTDLTWDADFIKDNLFPLPFCLKSDMDFKGHDKYDHKKNARPFPCNHTISGKEQIQMFGRDSQIKIAIFGERSDKMGISQLSGLTRMATSLGLDNSELLVAAKNIRDTELLMQKSKEIVKDTNEGRDSI